MGYLCRSMITTDHFCNMNRATTVYKMLQCKGIIIMSLSLLGGLLMREPVASIFRKMLPYLNSFSTSICFFVNIWTINSHVLNIVLNSQVFDHQVIENGKVSEFP